MDDPSSRGENPFPKEIGSHVGPREPDKLAADTPSIATTQVSFDSHTESVSLAIISMMAAHLNTTPMALDPLYSVVDPDALNDLFRRGSDGFVSFTYHGYEVVVTSDGEIALTGR